MNNSKKLIFSIVLICSLILIGVSSLIIIESSREDGAYAVVYHAGECIAQYPLTENGRYELSDGKNLLIIEDGAAYMESASCPDKLCLFQRRISKSGQRIVCLPNKIMVEIVGAGEEIFIN